MTNKEKQLLLKDLCGRIPYGVICHYNCVIPIEGREFHKANCKDVLKGIIPTSDGHIGFMVGFDRVNALEGDIKPYLRHMSSMTEKYAWKKEEPLLDGERLSFCFNPRIDAFKAGAEWMAEQGETFNGYISMKGKRSLIAIEGESEYKFGDKVIVQIRKK